MHEYFINKQTNNILFYRYVGPIQEEPSIDASPDMFDTSVTVSDGITTLVFTRAIDTGDSSDDFTLDQPRYILWAYGGSVTYGNPNVIGQHAMANRGIFDTQLDFSACGKTCHNLFLSMYCIHVHCSALFKWMTETGHKELIIFTLLEAHHTLQSTVHVCTCGHSLYNTFILMPPNQDSGPLFLSQRVF